MLAWLEAVEHNADTKRAPRGAPSGITQPWLPLMGHGADSLQE